MYQRTRSDSKQSFTISGNFFRSFFPFHLLLFFSLSLSLFSLFLSPSCVLNYRMLKRSGKAHLPLTKEREGESERARARKDRSKPLASSHTSSRNFTPACIVATLRFRIDYVYRSELTSCRERNCFSPLEYDRSMNGPRPSADRCRPEL